MVVIEWLKFRVAMEVREFFIQQDEEIWTTMLTQYKGFLGKEVWLSPDPRELVVIVRWETKEDWDAIPQDALEETEQKFAIAMNNAYDLIETGEYQVRKFLHHGV